MSGTEKIYSFFFSLFFCSSRADENVYDDFDEMFKSIKSLLKWNVDMEEPSSAWIEARSLGDS